MPPERRRENGVGREEGRRSVSALGYIMSCCANYESTRSAMQTSICQKRPIFRIQYFRPSKCRPLKSANAPPVPPPLGSSFQGHTTSSSRVRSIRHMPFHISGQLVLRLSLMDIKIFAFSYIWVTTLTFCGHVT